MNQKNKYDPYYREPMDSSDEQVQQNPYIQQNTAPNSSFHPYSENNEMKSGFDPYDDFDDDEDYDAFSFLFDEAYMEAEKEPEEEKKKHRFFFWLIFFAALIVFLYSAFQLFKILKANWDEKREKDRIIEIGNIPEDPEAPFTINWEALKKENDQIKAWIIVPDTNISYPIVQGTDNDYYLHMTYQKTYNFAGTIFIDYANNRNFQDLNTIVYGHNMKDGSMFGILKRFVTENAYSTSPYFWMLTPEKNYKYEIFSAHTAAVNSLTYTLFSKPGKEYTSYLNEMKAMGTTERGVCSGFCWHIRQAPPDYQAS